MLSLKLFRERVRKLDFLLLGGIGSVIGIGLLELYSISPSLEGGFLIFKKQVIFSLIGILIAGSIALFFDYRSLRDRPGIILGIYFGGVILLGLVLVFGAAIRGSRGWFKIGSFNFDPAEAMKIALIILLAKFFSSRHVEMFRARHLVASFFYLALPLSLIFLQPDLGSALVLGGIWFGMVLVAGIKPKHFLAVVIIVAVLAVILWSQFLKDYQRARIIAYFNPSEDPLGYGYSIIQSRTSISNGGFWGKGLGRGSETQLGFLPERHTDFIFSSIGEEMGFVGIFLVLVGYGIIIWRLSYISLRARDNFGALLAAGIGILIFIQTFININVAIGWMPVTGLSLPLISYGGSGLIFTLLGLGLALSVISNR